MSQSGLTLSVSQDSNFRIQFAHIPELETLKVSELMLLGCRIWDQDLVMAILDEKDILNVIKTLIALQGSHDSFVCILIELGNFLLNQDTS